MATISADKLRHEIQLILRDADLNTLSSKKVRQMLEATFKCDFTERKREIDDILMAEITTRDIMPIPSNVEPMKTNDHTHHETTDEESQAKKMKTQANNDDNNQPKPKSDEEIAMEIHQQENRPSLRRSIVS
jgi:hypothetical protein